MEKTLLEMYEGLINYKDNWSYYDNPPFLSCDTLFSGNASFNFIKECFSCGGKEMLFEDKYVEKELDIVKKRAPHIVSTYLLGIIIANIFNLDFCTRDKENMNPLYVWFLSCLYHDIGYIYEDNPCCEQLRKIQTGGLAALKEICNIKYCIYCQDNEVRTYNKDEVSLYLSYRAQCSNGRMGVIDHGIAGGMMLYDRLRKNFEQAWEKKLKECVKITRESFCYNNLHFSTAHFRYYAKAADAIISHNIWADTLKKCLESNGEQYESHNKIQETNTIAFILALADSIEPTKKYNACALKEIRLKENGNGFDLIMPATNYKKLEKSLKELPNWVEISVSKTCNETNNTFSIERKQ